MEQKIITPQEWIIMKSRNCDRGKHRFRMNKYGVTWCVICGHLSTSPNEKNLEKGERILIKGSINK